MSLDLRTLDDVDVKGKKVFLRVDYNVPIQGKIVGDRTRIESTLPTIREILAKGGRIALFSHLGRPKGVDPEYSLKPLQSVIQSYFPNNPILFKDGDYSAHPDLFWKDVPDHAILLAENLRFYKGEEENDRLFAKELSQFADIMVNDAFATCHRAHASIVGISEFLTVFAGRLLESELKSLYQYYISGKQPFMAVIGGSKISSKIEVLNNLIPKISILGIGGAMANTFLLAQGYKIGKSLVESGQISIAKDILMNCEKLQKKVILPRDVVVAKEMKQGAENSVKDIADIQEDDIILDMGPKSLTCFKEALLSSKTLLWNGPLGAFETKPFDRGTNEFAIFAADLTRQKKIVSITGGGDSVAALTSLGIVDQFSYVSTGGGAFLEWLEGRTMPGLEVLFKTNPVSRAIIF